MNICLLGCGMQGRVIAWDLAKAKHNVTVLDANSKNFQKLKKLPNIKTKKFDVKDRRKLVNLLKKFDIVVGALPSALGFYSMKCAVDAGIDMVDISYLPEDPFLLDKIAKRKRIRIVPDAGFAPGLSNILVGEAYQILRPIDRIRILAGGIPQNPIPPFNYRITWSPADLLEEYLRPARIRKNSKTVTVDSLSGLEEFNLRRIGKLECFYTDGLRTLLKTFKDIKNMEEKTIRYRGHANLFQAIIDCGLLSDEPIKVDRVEVAPKKFTLETLKPFLTREDEKDICLLIIEASNKQKAKRYICIDYYDDKNKITSMARMTGFTCSIITQCIKDYPEFGVIPPEYLGMDKRLCYFIKKGLKERGIRINC
jgi:lysine 6-dehydrogenase